MSWAQKNRRKRGRVRQRRRSNRVLLACKWGRQSRRRRGSGKVGRGGGGISDMLTIGEWRRSELARRGKSPWEVHGSDFRPFTSRAGTYSPKCYISMCLIPIFQLTANLTPCRPAVRHGTFCASSRASAQWAWQRRPSCFSPLSR